MQAKPKSAVKVTRKVDVSASSTLGSSGSGATGMVQLPPTATALVTTNQQNQQEADDAMIDGEPSTPSPTPDVAAHASSMSVGITVATASSSSSHSATATLTPPRSKDATLAVSPRGTGSTVAATSARFRTPPKAPGAVIPSSDKKSSLSSSSATTLSRLSQPRPASSSSALGTASATKRTSMAPAPVNSSVSSSSSSAPSSSPSARRISTLPLSGASSAHITIKPKIAASSRPTTATTRPVSVAPTASSSSTSAPSDDKSVPRPGHSRLPSTAASAAAAAVRRANLAAKASEAKSSSVTSKLSKLHPLLTPSSTAPSSAVNSPQSGKPASTAPLGSASKPVSSASTPSASAAAASAAAANASLHLVESDSALSNSHLVAAALLAHDSDEEVDGYGSLTSPDSSAANSPAIIVKTKSATTIPNVEVPPSINPPQSPSELTIAHAAPVLSTTPVLAPIATVASNVPLSLIESHLAALQAQVTQLTLANSQQAAQIVAVQSAAAAAAASAQTASATQDIETTAAAAASQLAEQQRQLIETVTSAVTAQINATLPNLIQLGVQAALQAALQPAVNASLPSAINASLPAAIESIFESTFPSRLSVSVPALIAPMLESAHATWLGESNQATLALLQGYETENQKEMESKERERQDQYETDTVRMLANIASVQTNIQSTTASLERLVNQLEEQEKRIVQFSEEQSKAESNVLELVQKISAVEAGAVLLRSDFSTAQATDVDHAMLLSEHKKTLMHLTRLVQEHADRLVEWEGLSQHTSRTLKQHDEFIKQAKAGKDATSNEHAASIADSSTAATAPPTGQVIDLSSLSNSYPSITAFDALRSEHNELKSSLAEKSVQLEQMRTIVMKLITRGGSGGLDILASLISPSPASSPTSAAISAQSVAPEDIEAKWALKKAERAAKSAAKNPNLLAVDGVMPITSSAAPSPSIQPTPAPNTATNNSGLSVSTSSGFSGISSSPNQSPRPSFTLDGSPSSSLASTPAASPQRPAMGTAAKLSAFSLSGTTTALNADASLDADRKKKGVWATPAVARPCKVVADGVSVTWTVHFNSARQYIPAPPLRLMRLQQKTRPSKVVASTPRRPGASTASAINTLPLTTPLRSTSSNSSVGVSLEDLPASSKKRKSHLRHHAIESRAGAELETYVEPVEEIEANNR